MYFGLYIRFITKLNVDVILRLMVDGMVVATANKVVATIVVNKVVRGLIVGP